jgi:hypothetical protein
MLLNANETPTEIDLIALQGTQAPLMDDLLFFAMTINVKLGACNLLDFILLQTSVKHYFIHYLKKASPSLEMIC